MAKWCPGSNDLDILKKEFIQGEVTDVALDRDSVPDF